VLRYVYIHGFASTPMSMIAEVTSTKRFNGKKRTLQMDDGATSWDIEYLEENLDHTTAVGDRY
jgi:predicted esterase YcpF (UPF0227 family)